MVLLSRQFQITPNYSVHTSAKTPCKKTILTITSPLLNLSGNLPTQCSKPPIFKLTGFNLRKENCKFTWSATAPRFCISAQRWGQLCIGGKDKIFMCLSSEIPQGWFTFIQKWLPWQLPNVRKNNPAEVCIFSCF